MALSVGIVGAGTAGSAAATVLARLGHDVTVYERVATPGPVGAGLLMQPTGLEVLRRLGIDAPVRNRGSVISQLRCVTPDGRTIFTLKYGDMADGLHGVGLHRGVLFRTLFDAAAAAGARMVTGAAAVRITSHGRQRCLVMEDGTVHGPHDLVIVASGSRNALAEDDAPMRRAVAYPWGALWFVAKSPNAEPELFQVVRGTQRMLGILPAGLGPTGDTPLATVFWSIPVRDYERIRDAGLSALAETLTNHTPHARPLVDQLTDMQQVLFSAYYDVRMPRWDNGPVLYIGDAGHAMSPQLGQGANIALADAFTLGHCVSRTTDLTAALATYSRLRSSTLRYYQFATRWLTPFFQSDHGWLAPLRDLALPIATRFGPSRAMMLRSMTGFQRGYLRTADHGSLTTRDLP